MTDTRQIEREAAKDAEIERLRADNERLRRERNRAVKLWHAAERELAATRERAICHRTAYPYCDADLDMHAEAMVAAERERCARGLTADELQHIARKLTTYADIYTGDKEARRMARRCAEAAAIRKGKP